MTATGSSHRWPPSRIAGFAGAPIEPTGNPDARRHRAGRLDRPRRPCRHHLRRACRASCRCASPSRRASPSTTRETDPRGFDVLGADGEVGGKVADLWVDRSEHLFRYVEVEAGGHRVLVPMNLCRVGRHSVTVRALLGAQIAGIPRTAKPDQVTWLEEEKIFGYLGGGLLYAEPGRAEPLIERPRPPALRRTRARLGARAGTPGAAAGRREPALAGGTGHPQGGAAGVPCAGRGDLFRPAPAVETGRRSARRPDPLPMRCWPRSRSSRCRWPVWPCSTGWRWRWPGTTLYTITDRRVVMRIGMVLTVTYNLPLSQIAAADLRREADGSGDLRLRLAAGQRIPYAHLWPHARPWRLASPEPALRCLAAVDEPARSLGEAWLRVQGQAGRAVSVSSVAAPSAQPGIDAAAVRRWPGPVRHEPRRRHRGDRRRPRLAQRAPAAAGDADLADGGGVGLAGARFLAGYRLASACPGRQSRSGRHGCSSGAAAAMEERRHASPALRRRADKSVQVLDADRAEVYRVVGEAGFVRGILRGMARERRRLGKGPEQPFELSLDAGLLTLRDLATGGQVELTAFGPTNAGAFARMLLEPPPAPLAAAVAGSAPVSTSVPRVTTVPCRVERGAYRGHDCYAHVDPARRRGRSR
jgi:putative photosynthetic complex assembly protein